MTYENPPAVAMLTKKLERKILGRKLRGVYPYATSLAVAIDIRPPEPELGKGLEQNPIYWCVIMQPLNEDSLEANKPGESAEVWPAPLSACMSRGEVRDLFVRHFSDNAASKADIRQAS